MTELKLVGEILADSALRLSDQLVRDSKLPSITDEDTAASAIERVAMQDKLLRSFRFFGAVFATFASAAQAWNGDWVSAVLIAVPGLAAAWSKYNDPRPTQ